MNGILRGHTLSTLIFMNLTSDWIAGFTDGEGCFHVSVNRHKELKIGFQVLPEFVITQHERDIQVLYAIKKFFGYGTVRSNHDDRSCLRIRDRVGLNKVCEFFMRTSLKTRKAQDFYKFRTVLLMMNDNKHLNTEGLIEIIDIIKQMNTQDRSTLNTIREELKGKDMVHTNDENVGDM
jgi:hypothetical protein